MPLYEYQCEQCGNRFERIQKFSDPPADTCPKCGGPVKKLLSSPAIQFKGSGWYITDYAKKSSTDAGKRGGKADSGASGSSSSGDSTSAKSDSKPADSGSKSKD
jgi:putative FmdB family regulatory protein